MQAAGKSTAQAATAQQSTQGRDQRHAGGPCCKTCQAAGSLRATYERVATGSTRFRTACATPTSYWPCFRQLMREEARARGLEVDEDARGLVYNAPISRVVDFLQVGTQTQI